MSDTTFEQQNRTGQISLLDTLISTLDDGLRATFTRPAAQRQSPATELSPDPMQADRYAAALAGALMRVNHVGEVCAQALYQGQALTSRSQQVREKMRHAAEEEIDHLNWCYQRIEQLGSHTSLLNPLWYAGSFVIGVSAGLAGDRWSLGFLAETEKQVVEHLHSHLERLPEQDTLSRAIVEQMAEDEAQHAEMAVEQGGVELPEVVKNLMRFSAKIMTTLSEKI